MKLKLLKIILQRVQLHITVTSFQDWTGRQSVSCWIIEHCWSWQNSRYVTLKSSTAFQTLKKILQSQQWAHHTVLSGSVVFPTCNSSPVAGEMRLPITRTKRLSAFSQYISSLSSSALYMRRPRRDSLSFYPFTATLFLLYSTTVSLPSGSFFPLCLGILRPPWPHRYFTSQSLLETEHRRDKKKEIRAKPHKKDLCFSTVLIGTVWCAGSHCWGRPCPLMDPQAQIMYAGSRLIKLQDSYSLAGSQGNRDGSKGGRKLWEDIATGQELGVEHGGNWTVMKKQCWHQLQQWGQSFPILCTAFMF